MAADGATYGTNITNFSTSRPGKLVVDGILNSTTFASRLLYNAKPFSVDGIGEMPTLKKDIKISRRSQFQWFNGLEQLNSAAENVTIQMEFNHTSGTMPVVEIMTESFAREGAGEDVDFPAFNMEDAVDESLQELSSAVFGVGTGDRPLGLEAIVDDGTNVGTIGGQSRSTYASLQAEVTASSGTMTLSKLATLKSAIADSGAKESPTVIVTTDAIADLYQQFLTPTVQYEYKVLPMSGRYPVAGQPGQMGQGFGGVNTYDGIPIIRDKGANSGVLYMLNENYLTWHGRTKVPRSFKKFVSNLKLGKSVKEGQAAMKPSDFHGFFYQAEQMMPGQAGIIGRIFLFGQLVSFQPRRHGKLTGITSVA